MEAHDYISNFKRLIARERNAEIEFHTNEIKSLKDFVRETKGRTLTLMSRQPSKSEDESIFRFVKSSGKLPNNEFSVDSNVLISVKDPLNDGLKGVVVGKTQNSIDIYIPSQSNMLYKDKLRIDLFVNDVTYNIQNTVLDSMAKWSFEKGNIREILLHTRKPKMGKAKNLTFFDDSLNDSQKLAIKYSLREEEFYLIQGPPGTGKTKTSIEIIRQHLKYGKKILVTGDSNMAVDNIMIGLLKHFPVIRIGESSKILPEIQEHTLKNTIRSHFEYKIIEQGLQAIAKYRESQRDYIFPSKSSAKGISHFQIQKLAQRGQSEFGISAADMKSMSQWINLQAQIKQLQLRVQSIQDKITKECIKTANVICTTNTNAASPYLDKVDFDLVLIDEAGQSTEPSCLVAISKAKKVILVGDHKQLPPTILSQDAKELSISLFERMIQNTRFTLLNTQYRMNPLINEFPSDEFYNSELKSADSTINNKPHIFSKNVVFIECHGEEKRLGTSIYNEDEIQIVSDLIPKYLKTLDSNDIGIITPYGAQAKKLDNLGVESKTIDGFQGREKKVIIISLTRSSSMGFLSDFRRLNVALTRAIDELVVIGNPNLLIKDETYNRFIEFVKKNGIIIKK